MQSFPLLSLAIWVPILFGAAVLWIGSDSNPRPARWLALTGSLVGLLLTIPLVTGFNNHIAAAQFVERLNWIPEFDITYHLGLDGVSLWLVALTAFTTLIIVIASWRVITVHVAQYLAAFLFLSGLMIGAFAALDGMLFFVFFEATLIPMYLLIGGWGGTKRVHAAFKFFLISLVGSLLMLIALLYLFGQSNSFDIASWYALRLGFVPQLLIFIGFFAAFAVKVPMWPIHTWLPEVHLEAPTGASVILGMLKLGAYGFIRFTLPITPQASHFFAPVMIALSLVAVIYGSLVALSQTDMSRLMAYSSISHMGLVTLGLFIFNQYGIEGAIVQMISYGFISGAMFLCIGVLYERTHTRAIDAYGGVASVMPKFAVLTMLFAMANVGLPGTSGFVGEFLVIMGAIKFNFWIGALAALTLILSAAYTLSMYKRTIFGSVGNDNVARLVDIGKRELIMLGAMAFFVLLIGVNPRPFTDAIDASVTTLLSQTRR
ncbi:MAG: NADH:ubiquinone oxidoreductase subunit [Herbaspirillum sp.]|nr:NADH:ubiquinone oxidoreductase subunit [Herbaspirillum sp.]